MPVLFKVFVGLEWNYFGFQLRFVSLAVGNPTLFPELDINHFYHLYSVTVYLIIKLSISQI